MSGRTWTSWKLRRNLLSSETILPEGKMTRFPKTSRARQLRQGLTWHVPSLHLGLSHPTIPSIFGGARQSNQVGAHRSCHSKTWGGSGQEGSSSCHRPAGTVMVAAWL